MYGLSPTPPPAGFEADFIAHDASIWDLNKDDTVATQGTKKYSWPLGYLYNSRRKCGNGLLDDDWEIGYQISTGPYAGMYVWEPHCLGGKFLSFEDGGKNRPPFNSGVDGDKTRNIFGFFQPGNAAYGLSIMSTYGSASGAFSKRTSPSQRNIISEAVSAAVYNLDFNSSLIVPTGPQNSPKTAPKLSPAAFGEV